MGRRLVFFVALVFAWVVVPAVPAQATFPGDNGSIAFRRFLNVERTWGAIFTIRPDGRGERQVTNPPFGYVDRDPDVSPDGRKIAFQRESVDCGPDCHSNEVFVVNADGSHLRQLTEQAPGTVCGVGGTCNESPAWSPDGRYIAFARGRGPIVDDYIESAGIYVMRADGSHVRQITQKVLPTLGEDFSPQWSPDGHKLVFQRNNKPGADPPDGIALWTVNLVTGRERSITPYPIEAGDTPDWSPDGRRILFHSNNSQNSNVSANLYTVRPDGTGLRQLTFETGGTVNYLGSSYSPDGTMITFGRRPETAGAADIFVAQADATRIRPVTRTPLYDSYPDWGPAR